MAHCIHRCVLLLLLISTFTSTVHAQCNCTYSIDSSITMLNNDTVGLKPGDTLCISAGIREYLTLLNFHGNADSTLVVINCGGQVVVNTTNSIYYQQGINLKHCKYLQFTGTGDTSIAYGFEIQNTNIGSGLDARDGSTHLEIDHLEISGTSFAGMIVKDDPKCNGDYTRAQFVMRDIHIHDNYIHHTDGEGIYLGVTSYDGFAKDCSGDGIVDTLLLGHEVIGVNIHDNLMDSIGREGIQVFSAPRDVKIHHNRVTNYGLSKEAAHNSGIQLGDGCAGNIYNNFVKKGYGSGIHISADSTCLVFNNIIDEAGMHFDDQNSTELDLEAYGVHIWDDRVRNSGFYFGIFNNTIVRAKKHGIKQYGGLESSTKTALIYNNVILAPGLMGVLSPGLLAPMSFDYIKNVTESHNFVDTTTSNAGFINPANGNFRLKNTSFLINQGKDLSSYGINTDFADSTRPVDTLYDLGAYEHQTPSAILDAFPGFTPDGCHFVLYPSGAVLDGANYNYQNGNVFCLVSAEWLPIRITNFHGSEDSAITFRNYQGKIDITGGYGIQLNESSNIEIKGDGDAGHTYGFQIRNTTGNGLDINLTTGYNIHHVLVDSAGNSAINNQDSPCEYGGAASRDSFVQKNCQIHHCKFKRSQGSNCLAIGNPSYYYSAQGTCGLAYHNQSMRIYDNIFEDNTSTALLLSATDSNTQVYGNTFSSQEKHCIYLDRGAFANVHSNLFESEQGPAIRVNEAGPQYIHNNVFKGLGQGVNHGIEFRPKNASSTFIRQNKVLNNTMVLDSISEGIYFYDSGCDTNNTLVANNIIIVPGATGTLPRPYVRLAKTHGAQLSNNLFLDNVDSAYFTSPGTGDYSLTSSSPAVDAGMDLSNDTFLIDFYRNSRPDSLLEIGAFQYSFSASKKGRTKAPTAQPSITEPLAMEQPLGLYPNPVENTLYFAGMEVGDRILSFHDVAGKSHSVKIINHKTADVSQLAEGLYVVRILSRSNEVKYLSFLKK